MIECGSLEYAQARLQARHGQRLDEPGWHRIEVMRDFAPMLELARGTALRPWLVGITAETGAREIETRLRGHWRACVAELQGWMPAPWQPAVAWCAELPELAPLQHLARGGALAPWMEEVPALQSLAQARPAARAGLLQAGPWAALARAWSAPEAIGAAWLAEWRARLPHADEDGRDMLAQVVRTLTDHADGFAAAPAPQGWLLRAALQGRLALLLRRAALQPATAFIHIALCALELERLRAELLRRVLFPRWKVA